MVSGIYAKLYAIQQKLNAPKNQYNSFGKYSYRSCEDILEAVKPLLAETCTTLTMKDEVIPLGSRYYVETVAELHDIDSEGSIIVSAMAREPEVKKGMDESQITGAASSYARKYALNALFAIDDCNDADATNTHGKEENADKKENELSDAQIKRLFAIASKAGITKDQVLMVVYKEFKMHEIKKLTKQQYETICNRLEKKGEEKQNE